MSPQEKILEALKKTGVEYRIDDCVEVAQKAFDNGLYPTLIAMEGLAGVWKNPVSFMVL